MPLFVGVVVPLLWWLWCPVVLLFVGVVLPLFVGVVVPLLWWLWWLQVFNASFQ